MPRNTVTVSLRLEPEEAAKWKMLAGVKTLTDWIRERCNGGGEIQAESKRDGVPPVRGDREVRVEERGADIAVGIKSRVRAKVREPKAVEPVVGGCSHDFGYAVGKCPYGTCANRNPKAVARCEHLTEKGYRCGFCGGLAKC